MDNKIRMAITQGDTNGIGYEVILKTFGTPTMLELCTPIVYGNPRIASYHRKSCGLETDFLNIQNAEEAKAGELNLLVLDEAEVPVNLGKETPTAAAQAFSSLQRALADWKEGKVDVLVTAPINKHSMQGEEFHFPGHTEYLEAEVGEGAKALMILLNSSLRVALVTTHLPVSQIAPAITSELIVEKVSVFDQSLKRDFGIEKPRIAVLSLNPHAGDGGTLGTEEQDIITPALEKAHTELGINAFGPYAADGFFGTRAYEQFDGILAMYHDQGLAPFKALAMSDGVNFTAGLPLVRTSPDHGTAYDIVGKGVADETSFRQAVYTALDIFRNRLRYDEARENPLPKLFRERREDERRPRREPFSAAIKQPADETPEPMDTDE
ncbi:MAG: 4-hydroxythreonine-4-phosphate dehydrogenase PdxA [Prevotellaceae bacterium]|nr:4-hydroxythreonine-4-phosphate dehydrogenase PdxA [Prevotellaceae bacterium]